MSTEIPKTPTKEITALAVVEKDQIYQPQEGAKILGIPMFEQAFSAVVRAILENNRLRSTLVLKEPNFI